MKYFIGNWKMFGVPRSINILNKINSFSSKDKNRNRYTAIITPPYTLLDSFAKHFKNKKLKIPELNPFIPTTASVPNRDIIDNKLPRLLSSDLGYELYFGEDHEFLRPKGMISLKILMPHIHFYLLSNLT